MPAIGQQVGWEHAITGPPDRVNVSPPTQTRKQVLPFGEITWENFERLCYRLAGYSDAVEDYRRYGRPGQAQEGVGVYARLSNGKYEVWQAKRYKTYSASDLREAVAKFLEGEWAAKAERFILAVRASLADTTVQKEIEVQAQLLKQHSIQFVPEGEEELSTRLKDKPELVDDFFGREWVLAFNGEDIANRMLRLDGREFARIWSQLGSVYSSLFQIHDRGIVSAPDGDIIDSSASLLDRFVEPDVVVRDTRMRGIVTPRTEPIVVQSSSTASDPSPERRKRQTPTTAEVPGIRRVSLRSWLVEGDQFAVIADAGMGKSMLLRCIALDMLGGQTMFPEIARRWGRRLPLYVPFARWARDTAISESPIGLKEIIARTWQQLLTADLIALLDRAIDERRVVLLVDGLDEWTDEQAASTVLPILLTFVSVHAIPTVVSGRPGGLNRIGSIPSTWRQATLAKLSPNQQRSHAHFWFDKLIPITGEVAVEDARQRQVSWQVERFFTSLRQAPELNTLAEVPLLLLGLLSLALLRVALPRNRVQAISQLVDLLLERHPAHRARAAFDTKPRFRHVTDLETRRLALGKLAFVIRTEGADAGYSVSEAKRLVRDYLADPDGHHGLSADRAQAAADEMLAVNAETVGLVVEKSPGDIGFVHAALGEFLAAVHIRSWPLSEAREFVAKHAGTDRWRPVIEGLAVLLPRKDEIDDLVGAIEAAELDVIGNINRRLLLAEIAFGPCRRSPAVGRRLMQNAFVFIEEGNWPRERARVLQAALNAIGDPVAGDVIEERLRSWSPRRIEQSYSVFQALSNWSAAPDLLEALWRGLYDQERATRREAAAALSKLHGGDPNVSTRLRHGVSSSLELGAAAAQLEALMLGWPSDPFILDQLDRARMSIDPTLRLVGVRGRVRYGIADESDRDRLLDLLRDLGDLDFSDRPIAAQALAQCWPNDPDIIDRCLASLSHHRFGERTMERDYALDYLMRCSPENPNIQSWLAKAFEMEGGQARSAALPFHGEATPRIALFAASNPPLHEAVVAHILAKTAEHVRYEYHDLIVALRDVRIRDSLLASARKETSWDLFWTISPLVRGWGREDEAVTVLFEEMRDWQIDRLAAVVTLLPAVFDDRAVCRAKVLEVARGGASRCGGPFESARRGDLLVAAFSAIGCGGDDEEVVTALLSCLSPEDSIWEGGPEIIAAFGGNPRVREYAVARAERRDPPVASMAVAYERDPELRGTVLRYANSLPADLRYQVAEAAIDAEHTGALGGLVTGYDLESGTDIKVRLSINYHTYLRSMQSDVTARLAALHAGVTAVGPGLDGRRAAAFAGYLSLGCAEQFACLEEHGRKLQAHIGDSLNRSGSLLGLIADHWTEIAAAFGGDVYQRVGRFSEGPDDIWEMLAPYIGPASPARLDFLTYCEATQGLLGYEGLRALMRDRPGSDLVYQHCLRCLEGTNATRRSALEVEQAGLEAAYILREQFADHDGIGEWVTNLVRSRNDRKSVVAWSLLKPAEVRGALPKYEPIEIGQRWGQWTSAAHLAAIQSDAADFVRVVQAMINRPRHSVWDFQHVSNRAITARLQGDPQAAERVRAVLSDAPTASEQASLSRYLVNAGLADQTVLDCCGKLLAEVTAPRLVEVAYDAVSDAIRPLAYSLLDVVASPGEF